MTESPDTQRVQELLGAGRLLLKHRADLDAVYVLHVEAARAMGARLPVRYGAVAEARSEQRRLCELLGARSVEGRGSQWRQLARRLPWWAPRTAVAGVIVLLTLRYAWAVTYKKDWARQNPEGNWISRYYTDDKFGGNPMLRYDIGVNADFVAAGPVDNMAKDYFSIRWDTCMDVTRAVTVPLTLQADDQAQLFVDGVSQVRVVPGPGSATTSVVLTPGVRHVRLEFVERAGMAMVRLDGFELLGNEAYRFVRPRVEGRELVCGG